MTFVQLPLQESSVVVAAAAATASDDHHPSEEDAAINSGSVVGLPMDYSKSNSMAGSFSDTEDESLDELTAAADLLARSLLVEQQQKQLLEEEEAKKKKLETTDDETTPVRKTRATTSHGENDNNEGEGDNGGDENDGDRRPKVVETTPRITPSPSPPPPMICEEEPDHSSSLSNRSLEERVQELETKLAALSRLLQGQQRLSIRSLLTRSPTTSQRHLVQSNNNDQQHHQQDEGTQYDRSGTDSPPPSQRQSTQTSIPYLESPAPLESPRNRPMHQRKRLSFHLLYGGNEDNLRRADDEDHSQGERRNRMTRQQQNHNNNNNHQHMPMQEEGDEINNNNDNENKKNCNNNSNTVINGNDQDNNDNLEGDIMNASENTNNNNGGEIDGKTLQEISADNNNNNNTSGGDGGDQEEEHPLKRSPSHEITNKHNTADDSMKSMEEQLSLDNKNSKSQHTTTATVNSTIADVAARVVKAEMPESRESSATSLSNVKNNNSNNLQKKTPQKTTKQTPSKVGSGSSSHSNNSSAATIINDDFAASNSNHSVVGGNKIINNAMLPPLPLSKDKRSKWLDHLNSFQESNYDVDVQMQEFIKVPGAVEKTLTSGFLICVDSFLYVCTILPIRFAWSCVLLSLHYFFKWANKPAGNLQFHRRHMYQLIQVGIIFFTYRYILLPISVGKFYHWIRGQAMIKLYVVIAMVEVFDRLMCSLGQDCLDSLYWNTTRRPRSSRMLISVSVVMIYNALHSLILFVHVATLNVAMNSADEALLALLIAGNFAEIKSTVFKKYNKPSLFKIVASDICERFKLALFLGLVLLLNFCQGMDSRKMSDYQRIAAVVWISELICDWLKHAFITKFNFIPSSVYPEYGLLLAGDVTGIGHEGVNLDHSHAVVKRIGFAQMPLVCVMTRLVREAAKYMFLRIDSISVPFFAVVLGCAGCWFLLLALKILLGAYLQRTSIAKLHALSELSQAPLQPKHKQQ